MPLLPALESKLASLPLEQAAEELVRGYGGELYSFLAATLDPEDADEAFAMFSEDVWRGLSAFRKESSYRTWAYQLARNAAHRLRRGDGRRERRMLEGGTSAADRVAWEVRSSTNAFKRTDVKDKVRALRDMLKPDERELLVLRVDRDLEWTEVASILGEDSTTVRKRFERTKEKLRVLAERAGLIGAR